MHLRHVLCVALAGPFVSAVRAQSAATIPPRRLSITVGLNSSTVGGEDAGDVSRRMGFIVGASMIAPLGSTLAIEPEVVFTTKGAKFHDSGSEGTFSMSYIQIPLL